MHLNFLACFGKVSIFIFLLLAPFIFILEVYKLYLLLIKIKM